jgi:hypothetical protein
MKTIRVVVRQGKDKQGMPEEFTCDLYPLVDSLETQHLNGTLNGNDLPIKGTKIKEGMILVGKGGRGSKFDERHMPTSLELHGLPRAELAAKYPNYWTNTSHYATKEQKGTVENAHFETIDGTLCAVVEITLS